MRRLLWLLGAAALGAATPDWEKVSRSPELSFPRDHGAHFSYRTEWWYLTGIVREKSGTELGYQMTIFRRGIDPAASSPGQSALRARHMLAGHFAVADVAGKRLVHAQRLRRVDGQLGVASEKDLCVQLESWEIERKADGSLSVRAADGEAGVSIDLQLSPSKAIVAHGEAGLSRKGAEEGNASVYLSWTRLATRGTVTVGDRKLEVSGESWFDHEWGTSQLGPGVVGWDWLGLRLADGRELMLYHLRDASGAPIPQSGGTLVERDGSARRLSLGDFSMEPIGAWRSERTKANYPTRWRVKIPSAAIEFEVEPLLADSELDSRATTGIVYWEGPVRLRGAATGEGYMELTGYAESMEKKL